MRYAVIEGGAVVNVIELTDAGDYPGAVPMTDALETEWRAARPAAAAVVVGVVTITKRQLLLWMLANKGKTETDILAAIDTISDPAAKAAAEIEFKYPDGGILHRDNPLFDRLGPMFGMQPADIDAAFVAARAL